MATYIYLHAENEGSSKSVQEEIQKYVDENRLNIDDIIEEKNNSKLHWQNREIGELLEKGVIKAGDSIVVYEGAHLARSTSQMLEILGSATQHKVNIHFVKYNVVFEAKPTNRTRDLVNVLRYIESDFISKRTTDALARRRAAGLPLGRPKGRQNKSLKLDKYKKDIMKYLDLQISKASIAKLVDCHPQTLYDWIDRSGVFDKKARKPRKAKAVAETTATVSVSKIKQTATV